MRVAFVLFDRVTFLDFIGFYDVITRIKTLEIDENLSWECCGLKEEIKDDKGLIMKPSRVGESLDGYDMVFIPGGVGTRVLQYDDIFLSWIKSSKYARYKVSTCTGSLLLGAAGFLKQRYATTHLNAYKDLEPYCKQVLAQRVVDENSIITSAGVSSSIDLGLHVSQKIYGKSAREKIATSMDYPYFYDE